MNSTCMESGKVRDGFYRVGAYCLHKGHGRWAVYLREKFIRHFETLRAAREWCRENQP